MNYGPLIFLAAFLGVAGSWFTFVAKPVAQLGMLQQTNSVGGAALYPLARAGMARQGLEVYRANGCAYCHSQQVVQTGTILEVRLLEAGTNQAATLSELTRLNVGLSPEEAARKLSALPIVVMKGVERSTAEAAIKSLNATSAKATIWVVPSGPDIARGWGKRRTVAEDFLYDEPALPGGQRIGPDLANVGTRLPDPNWHLRHLYAPKAEVPGSIMPAYRFLFETRPIGRVRSLDALNLPPGMSPRTGYEVVPKNDAVALVAYLTSLKAEAPLFSTPMSVASAPAASTTNAAPPGTNAPTSDGAGQTNSTPPSAQQQ